MLFVVAAVVASDTIVIFLLSISLVLGIVNAFAIVVTMASALAIVLAGTFSTQI